MNFKLRIFKYYSHVLFCLPWQNYKSSQSLVFSLCKLVKFSNACIFRLNLIMMVLAERISNTWFFSTTSCHKNIHRRHIPFLPYFSREPNYHIDKFWYLYKFPIFLFRQFFYRFVLPFLWGNATCCKYRIEKKARNDFACSWKMLKIILNIQSLSFPSLLLILL